jgi:hypothetical protein
MPLDLTGRPHLILTDRNLGEVLLLYEWGTPPAPWLFIWNPGPREWVSMRRATAEDLALFHGMETNPDAGDARTDRPGPGCGRRPRR